MLFDEAGEVLEMFRNGFPLTFLVFVPLLIIISPVSPVSGAHEFSVFRMQQYDLHGTQFGCRGSQVNMEARSIDAKMVTRRCLVARLRDVTMAKYHDLISQNAGALLILLPVNLTELSSEDKEYLQNLERALLSEETTLPVYFAQETSEITEIYQDVMGSSSSDQAASAVEALLSAATANGFQMVISGSQSKALPDFQITNIQGRLSGYGIEEQLPTILIVAHYDSFGIAPALAQGGDSNGSGVIALLELSRLFSKLYTNSRTHAKYNLLFLITGGGKFNYQGTKRWIEDNVDASESNLLFDIAFVLCLDTIGSGDDLFFHVSKPPKAESLGGKFQKHIEDVINTFHSSVKFQLAHKKINLADDILAWEHERFSIKRLLAFTLSRLESHKLPDRSTILDTRDNVDVVRLTRNIQILAEALARTIYNITSHGAFQLFTDGLEVQPEFISSWLEYLTSDARAAQLIGKDHRLLDTLEESMQRFLKDVKRTTVKADKRDPEFVFYDGAKYIMSAYNVKPAVFDLFLGVGIAAYLALVYVLALNFGRVYSLLKRLLGPGRPKQH